MKKSIDELEKQLAALGDSGDDEKRVDLLNELAEAYSYDEISHSSEVAQEALKLSQSIGYEIGEAKAKLSVAWAHYLHSNHDAAMPLLLEANATGEKLDVPRLRASSQGVLASIYLSLGDYEKALSTSMTALRIQRTLGDRFAEAWLLQGLGGGYLEMGDHERAQLYAKQSLRIFEEIDHAVGRGRALNGIGSAYQAMEKYDEAIDYHTQSLKIFRGAKNRLGESRALNDLGMIHQELGEFEKAKECHLRALELREEVGNKQAKSTSLLNLGRLYVEIKETKLAMEYLHRALTIAMEIRVKPRIYQVNLALSDAHAQAGDFSDALDHYKIYQQVKEEVTGDKANSRLRNLQIGFEVEQSEKEAEISRLKNVELREKNEQLQTLLTELRETQTQLVQTEKMASLGGLVSGVVHEINTPIGVIASANDVTIKCVTRIRRLFNDAEGIDGLRASSELQRCFEALQSDTQVTLVASERITKIVQSLKSFANLDEAEYQEADLHEGLDSALTLIEHDIRGRIDVTKEYGDVPKVYSNPGELNQVFMHLLTNAVHAIEGAGAIDIRTFEKDGFVHIQVTDTGVGIPEEHVDKIFDPSITKRGARVKAGLGLFTSFNIMKKHRGEINVESKVGKGTTFTLTLPTSSADGNAPRLNQA